MVSRESKTSSAGWRPVRSCQASTKRRIWSLWVALEGRALAQAKVRASASRARKQRIAFWRWERLET